jgi:hypothetical protein
MKITLKKLSEEDEVFKEACSKVNLPKKKHEKLGLKRQYSKWKRHQGLAYKEGRYDRPTPPDL